MRAPSDMTEKELDSYYSFYVELKRDMNKQLLGEASEARVDRLRTLVRRIEEYLKKIGFEKGRRLGAVSGGGG
jgi:hypothetical protein